MIRMTLATNLLIQGITFGTSILTARILGPIGRGELAVVLLYPQLVTVIFLLGVDRAVALRAGRGEMERPLLTIPMLTALLGLPAAVIAFVVIKLQIRDAHLLALSTQYLLYIPALYFFTLTTMFFNGTGDFERFNHVRLGFYVANLTLLAAIYLLDLADPLAWIVWANLASVYVGMLLALFLIRGVASTGQPTEFRHSIRGVFALALPFAFPAALGCLAAFAYQVVLERRESVETLGSFVVLYSYSRLISPLGNAIGTHVFHLGISRAQCDLAGMIRRGWMAYVCCGLPLGAAAPWAIPTVFGSGFVVEPALIVILLLACVFALSADTIAEYLRGRGQVRSETLSILLSVGVMFSFGWVLVPHAGAIGMAIAIALAEVLRCVVLATRAAEETGTSLTRFWQPTAADLAELTRAARKLVGGVR